MWYLLGKSEPVGREDPQFRAPFTGMTADPANQQRTCRGTTDSAGRALPDSSDCYPEVSLAATHTPPSSATASDTPMGTALGVFDVTE